jgi:hypothetical protein
MKLWLFVVVAILAAGCGAPEPEGRSRGEAGPASKWETGSAAPAEGG